MRAHRKSKEKNALGVGIVLVVVGVLHIKRRGLHFMDGQHGENI
jgi:hypothetical protein